jgi:hypothetical protein
VNSKSKIRLSLALREGSKNVVGHSDFSFPPASSTGNEKASVGTDGARQQLARRSSIPGGGQLTLPIQSHSDSECTLPLSNYVLVLDWSFVDWPAFRDLSALTSASTSTSAGATKGSNGMKRFSTDSSHNSAAAAAASALYNDDGNSATTGEPALLSPGTYIPF